MLHVPAREFQVPQLTAQKSFKTEGVTVSIYSRPDGLADEWKTLERTGHCTAFQRFGWVQAWCNHVAPARKLEPLIVVVRRIEDSAAIMILPLALGERDGSRVITFADGGVTDYNGPLVSSSFTADRGRIAQLWSCIRRTLPSADVIRMEKMPARIGNVANPLVDLPGTQMASLKSFGVPLGLPFDAWKASTLAPKFHQDMIAKTRKMGKAAKVRFALPSSEDEADAVFAALRAQRAERFAIMGRDEVMDDPDVRAFYRDMVSPTADRGGTLFALYGDDDIAATGLAIVDDRAVHMLMISHKSERWRNYSPGMQLFLGAMNWAAERGLPFFDFTTGGETYKVNFGTTASDLYQRTEGVSARGHAQAVMARIERSAKNLALRMGLKERLKALRAARASSGR